MIRRSATLAANTLSYDPNGHKWAYLVTNFWEIIYVKDIFATCDRIAAKGGMIVRTPGAMNHGTTVIAFVEDPTGYKVELIQLRDWA